MSRVATGDVVAVRPTANIYTVLTAAAVIAQIMAIAILFMRARAVGISFF